MTITIRHSPKATLMLARLNIPALVTTDAVKAQIKAVYQRTNWNEVRKTKRAISASMLGECARSWWYAMREDIQDTSPIVPEWKMEADIGGIYHAAIQAEADTQGIVATINGKKAIELTLDASVMSPERYAQFQQAGISDRTRLDFVLLGEGGQLRVTDIKSWNTNQYTDLDGVRQWLRTGDRRYITGRWGESTASKKLVKATLQNGLYAYALGQNNGAIAVVRRGDGATEGFTHDVPPAIIEGELERAYRVTQAIKTGEDVPADNYSSCAFCAYWNHCDAPGKGKSVLFSYRDAIPNEPELAIVANAA